MNEDGKPQEDSLLTRRELARRWKGRTFAKGLPDVAISEINKKTDLKITIGLLERSKHRRVDWVFFRLREDKNANAMIQESACLQGPIRPAFPSVRSVLL